MALEYGASTEVNQEGTNMLRCVVMGSVWDVRSVLKGRSVCSVMCSVMCSGVYVYRAAC